MICRLVHPWTPPDAGLLPREWSGLPTARLGDAQRLRWKASPAGSPTTAARSSPHTSTDTQALCHRDRAPPRLRSLPRIQSP
jgi:hypothetical protein